jgi:hypothetical protein
MGFYPPPFAPQPMMQNLMQPQPFQLQPQQLQPQQLQQLQPQQLQQLQPQALQPQQQQQQQPQAFQPLQQFVQHQAPYQLPTMPAPAAAPAAPQPFWQAPSPYTASGYAPQQQPTVVSQQPMHQQAMTAAVPQQLQAPATAGTVASQLLHQPAVAAAQTQLPLPPAPAHMQHTSAGHSPNPLLALLHSSAVPAGSPQWTLQTAVPPAQPLQLQQAQAPVLGHQTSAEHPSMQL